MSIPKVPSKFNVIDSDKEVLICQVPSKFNVTDSDKEVLPQDSISNHCHRLPVDLAVYFTLQLLPNPQQWTQPLSSLHPSPTHHNGLSLFPLSAPPHPTTMDSTSFLSLPLPNPPQWTQPLSSPPQPTTIDSTSLNFPTHQKWT